MSKFTGFLAVLGLVFSANTFADHMSNHSIKDRIKASGKVYREGDDVPVSKPPVVETTGPRDGKTIYDTKCAACHATDAIGAPMFGNKDSWAPRIAKGIDTLVNHAINGLNAMPPKGTCGDCSDDELKATVEYMVNNSQ